MTPEFITLLFITFYTGGAQYSLQKEDRKEGGRNNWPRNSWRSNQTVSGITLWTQPSTQGLTHSNSAQHVFYIPRKDPSLMIFPRNASLWNEHNPKKRPEKVKTWVCLSNFSLPILGPHPNFQPTPLPSTWGDAIYLQSRATVPTLCPKFPGSHTHSPEGYFKF